MARTPTGFKNISTTFQRAYQTYDGAVQVRQISARLWEVLPRGGASFYETTRLAALERASQLSMSSVVRRKR